MMTKKMNERKKIENPFEKFANSKKKHEILNRRVKGEDRNVGRARAKAVDERKKKLLKDYKTSKKSNSFSDRRFGEEDTNLSLEDKMFLRFQKEKIKKARNASLFNLDSGEELLTHKGKTLSDHNYDDESLQSSDDEGLGKDVVSKLHFGGGLVKKPKLSQAEDNDEEIIIPKRSRLDMLQEIVMKSKLHKLERKEAKDEQEKSRDELDKAFEGLVSESLLKFKPVRADRSEEVDPNDEEFADYDIAIREMAFDAKAKTSNRTKSAEEIAIAAKEKLEQLESERLRRMKANYRENEDSDQDEIENALTRSLGNKKKRKQPTDDEQDDFDGKYAFKKKGNKIQESNVEEEDNVDSEEEDSDDEGDDDDDDDDDEGEEEEEDEVDGAESDDDDEDDYEDDDDDVDFDFQENTTTYNNKLDVKKSDNIAHNAKTIQPATKTQSISPSTKAASTVKTTLPLENQLTDTKKIKQSIPAAVTNHDIPFSIPCPNDISCFEELVTKYVRKTTDLIDLVDRILAWNSIHLPGAQGNANKDKIHNFLDILMKYFSKVGDSLACYETMANIADTMCQLDYICKVIFRISNDLTSDSCAPLWGRWLKYLQSQLGKRLRDFQLASSEEKPSCWPSLGQLLLFRVLGHVFAVTDYHHAIVTTATLQLCQYLSQCPVITLGDISSGLLCCSIILDYIKDTSKYVPEVTTFTRTILSLFLPTGTTPTYFDRDNFLTVDKNNLSFLRQIAATTTFEDTNIPISTIPWNVFKTDGVTKEVDLNHQQQQHRIVQGILLTCEKLSLVIVNRANETIALPETVGTLFDTLRALRPQDAPILPKHILQNHVSILETMTTAINTQKSTRQPLQWRIKVKMAIPTLAPRFEVDYAPKKDLDPNQARVEVKQLNRQLKREKKAAMRELRRDADFLDQERHLEQTEAKIAKKAEYAANFAWMEEQQATMNQHVKQGKGLLKGGGSGIRKKARVKR